MKASHQCMHFFPYHLFEPTSQGTVNLTVMEFIPEVTLCCKAQMPLSYFLLLVLTLHTLLPNVLLLHSAVLFKGK